jgi:hypothetical protein
LQRELCQRIHYEALLLAERGVLPETIPQTVNLPLLRHRAQLLGREIYLQHPATIDALFAGVSLAAYQLVEELYCSRFERSISLVWRIVEAMSHQAQVATIPYETVWALCMHLHEQRKLEAEVTLQAEDTTWQITQIPFEPGGQPPTEHRRVVFVSAIDLAREVVLAFRLTDHSGIQAASGLVIYDALVQHRRPSRDGAAGLAWHVPREIVTQQPLTQDCQDGCKRLGIQIASSQETPPWVQSLQTHWQQEIGHRSLPEYRWGVTL